MWPSRTCSPISRITGSGLCSSASTTWRCRNAGSRNRSPTGEWRSSVTSAWMRAAVAARSSWSIAILLPGGRLPVGGADLRRCRVTHLGYPDHRLVARQRRPRLLELGQGHVAVDHAKAVQRRRERLGPSLGERTYVDCFPDQHVALIRVVGRGRAGLDDEDDDRVDEVVERVTQCVEQIEGAIGRLFV